MFNPLSRGELAIIVGAVVIVSALALRGAWDVLQDAAGILMPFLIWVDAAGR